MLQAAWYEIEATEIEISHVAGCQNSGPFLGTLYIRGRIRIGIQEGTIILTTTHVDDARIRLAG